MTAITTAAHIDAQTQEELMRQAGIWIEHSTLIEDDLPARPLAAVQAEKHQLDRYTQLVADRAAARDSKCLAQIEEPAALAGTTIEQYARMFNAACEALGQVSDCLGINSDIDPGAEPIIAAIEQLRAGKTHPVLDDNWKARMLDGRAPERDEMGLGDHPELPWLDEGMMPRSFFAALGLELAHTSAEDQLDGDVLGAMSEAVNWSRWMPTAPKGDGWKLVSIFDTEDGPVAWWLRELPEAEDGTTTIRILQAEVEKLKARIARAGAAPAAVAPQGEYPPLPEGVMFIEQIGGDVIARPTEYAYFKNARGVVHGAQLFTADQLRAYFDLGRQAAPALEAPAAPNLHQTRDKAGILHYLTPEQMAEEIVRLDARLAAAPQAPAAPVGWVTVPRKITDSMIEAALAAHYGEKRLAAAGGAGGIDMTVDDTNYSGADAMRRMWCGALAAIGTQAAPAAPADVLCYIRPGATLPERHGFEVCRATDAGAMAVMGDGRAVVRAEPASKRIGQIVNPASEQSQDMGTVVVAEVMSNGYNGQVLWKGKVPPVGTLLYAAPQAAPAAPAVDTAELGEWVATLEVDSEGGLDYETVPPCTLPPGCYRLYRAAQAKEGGAQ